MTADPPAAVDAMEEADDDSRLDGRVARKRHHGGCRRVMTWKTIVGRNVDRLRHGGVHTVGDRAHLRVLPAGGFGSGRERVVGRRAVIVDADRQILFDLDQDSAAILAARGPNRVKLRVSRLNR